MASNDWSARVSAVSGESDEFGDNIPRERIDCLVAERPFIQRASSPRNLGGGQRSTKNFAAELPEGTE